MQTALLPKTLFQSPLALFYGVLVMGAFAVSAHIRNYQDLYYAPANIILILAALTAFLPALRKGIMIPATAVAFLILAFWGFIALSISWSSVPYASLVMFAMFCALPATFFGIMLSPLREELVKTTGAFLGFAVLLLAGSALLQHFTASADYGTRAHFPYANPNNLAALFNLALLPSLCFYLYSREKMLAGLSFVLTLIFFAALLATESRAALAAFGIAGLLVTAFSWRSPYSDMKKTAFLLGGLIITGLVFYLASPSSFLSERFLQGFSLDHGSSLGQRLIIWQAALMMALERPFTGTGYGTFFLYYPAYRLTGDASSLGFWAHMDPLQFWTEMGIIAPLLFYTLLAAILIRTIRALKVTPIDSKLRPVIWASFSALLTMALHSHFTFNLYVMSLLLMTGYLLALWYVYTHKALGDGFIPVKGRFYSLLTGALMTAFITLIALSGINAAAGPYLMKQALKEKAILNMTAYRELLGKADRLSPPSFIAPEIELAAKNIGTLERQSALMAIPERNDLIGQTRALLNEATYWNPVWPRIDVLKARLALIENEQDEALTILLRAKTKNPAFFEVNRALFVIYMKQGRVDAAYNLLINAMDYPRHPTHDLFYRKRLREIAPLVEIRKRYNKASPTNKKDSEQKDAP